MDMDLSYHVGRICVAAITILLTMSVFEMIVAAKVPNTSTAVPLIGQY